MMLAIYDNDTHCVINQKLTLEMLKEISDSEDVLEVTDVVARGSGPSHEHLDYKGAHDCYLSQEQFENQRSPIK